MSACEKSIVFDPPISNGWIGVDLDGTLAHYEGPKGADVIGPPIPAMVTRVKRWLGEGREVRIFTARVSGDLYLGEKREVEIVRRAIQRWCEEHIGRALDVTCIKDHKMIELWDDRAVRVKANTGEPCCKFSFGIFE